MKKASSLMHYSLGRENLCEVEGKDSAQTEAQWTKLWIESDHRTSVEPFLCQGVNALGEGGSGASGGKTLHASWPGVVFSGKVRLFLSGLELLSSASHSLQHSRNIKELFPAS